MKKVSSHTKIGIKKEVMTYYLLKISKILASAQVHAQIIKAIRT
jgi:hypothetical protein